MAGEVPVVRSFVTVAAGFFASTVMSLGGDIAFSRFYPDAFDAAGHARADSALFIKLAYETAFALVAGYITARLAIHKPFIHALTMGALVLLARAFVVVVTWGILPAWFQAGALVLIIPAALLGAKLSELRTRAPR